MIAPSLNEPLGLTLQQAAEQYTNRVIWKAYAEATTRSRAQRGIYPSLEITFMHEGFWNGYDPTRERDKLIAEAEQAGRALVEGLMGLLKSGELVATGIQAPLQMDSKRLLVQRRLFRTLTPVFRDSYLIGPGIKIVDVLIQRAGGNKPHSNDAAMANIVEISAARGRPPLPPDFAQEMLRRAEAGQLSNSFGEEAKYLYDWGDRIGLRNSKNISWLQKTITNKLSKLYRELKARYSIPK